MRSKGQGVNIDWVTALALFLFTLVSGIFLLVNDDASLVNDRAANREKAQIVQESLEEAAVINGRSAPLYVRGPTSVGRIPVDREYVFPESTYPGSGVMDIPSYIEEKQERVATVVKTGNRRHELTYFFENVSNLSYSNHIDTGAWINSSEIQLKTGGNGLESLRVNDKDVLDTDADLNSNNFTVFEKGIYVETLSGKLKVFNGSTELILENPGTVTFNLKNFTTLYWHNGSTTTSLYGTGTFNDSRTSAFTAATYQGDDYGVTFLGEMDAEVSKPDNDTVEAEITASDRLRIFLHDSDWKEGRNRSRFHTEGEIFFGSSKRIASPYPGKIRDLKQLTKGVFEARYELDNWGYNISFSSLRRGSRIPFEDVVVANRPTAVVGREGNYSIAEHRVAIWR